MAYRLFRAYRRVTRPSLDSVLDVRLTLVAVSKAQRGCGPGRDMSMADLDQKYADYVD